MKKQLKKTMRKELSACYHVVPCKKYEGCC
jgi:hypothetical protein